MTNSLACVESSYDDVAAEYYDRTRHPTCANFDELTMQFLYSKIPEYLGYGKKVLEVGAGRSIAAPIMHSHHLPLENLTLLDSSPEMLRYSAQWQSAGARFLIRDARDSGLPAGTIDLLVASLGDPYNDPAFWSEVRHLLDPDGTCLFTIPAPEWAARFRTSPDTETAEFLLKNGRTICVPSNIPPVRVQAAMIDDAGLIILDSSSLTAEALSLPHSPKLGIDADTVHEPVVRGYTISRRNTRVGPE